MVERQISIADYLTMDDAQLRTAVKTDPYTVLADHAQKNKGSGKPIVIDEVQRVPFLPLACNHFALCIE